MAGGYAVLEWRAGVWRGCRMTPTLPNRTDALTINSDARLDVDPASNRDFYHGHGCTCPRCEKAHACEVMVQGVGSGAIVYRITTPVGKEYMPVVNKSSEVVTCNCPNGLHLYRATCYHAQAAWLNYTTRDRRLVRC